MVTVENPVSAGVGYDPTLPVIVVVPVLVIPEYARTAKGAAVPRFTGVAAAACDTGSATNASVTSNIPTIPAL
jgi:hypothetical protein